MDLIEIRQYLLIFHLAKLSTVILDVYNIDVSISINLHFYTKVCNTIYVFFQARLCMHSQREHTACTCVCCIHVDCKYNFDFESTHFIYVCVCVRACIRYICILYIYIYLNTEYSFHGNCLVKHLLSYVNTFSFCKVHTYTQML